MTWTTDGRAFLKTAGAGPAAAAPGFAWTAAGFTLRIRMKADLQVLDPFGIIGGLDEAIARCTRVSLVRIGDMREASERALCAAETPGRPADTGLAFTLREGLRRTLWGAVTAHEVKSSCERIAGSDSAWACQVEKLKEVEVIDDRQGAIHLGAAVAPSSSSRCPVTAATSSARRRSRRPAAAMAARFRPGAAPACRRPGNSNPRWR